MAVEQFEILGETKGSEIPKILNATITATQLLGVADTEWGWDDLPPKMNEVPEEHISTVENPGEPVARLKL